MRHVWLPGLVVSLGVGLTSCGTSEEERRIEEAQQAAEHAADEMASGVEGLAKAMEGLASGTGGGENAPVAPVRFQDLQATLPDVPGWTMDTPRGERMTSPVPFSQTEANYTSGSARVEARIVDSGFNRMLLAPWSMFLAAGFERESSEGYERSVQIGGNPGFERWQSDRRTGELNLVVASRFLVTFEGRDIDDPKVLHEFMSRLDADRLAGLK